jgi:hypothetical protein
MWRTYSILDTHGSKFVFSYDTQGALGIYSNPYPHRSSKNEGNDELNHEFINLKSIQYFSSFGQETVYIKRK